MPHDRSFNRNRPGSCLRGAGRSEPAAGPDPPGEAATGRPRSPRSARRRSCWSAWSNRWPRSCWPSLDRSSVEAVTWEIARLERIDPAEQAAVLDEFLGLGIRRLCFVFEDLLRMQDQDIRRAYHHEDNPTWALALAGAAPPVRAKVLGALDAGSAAALRQSLEGLGPFRLSDAEAAQAEIAERFRRLHDQGRRQPAGTQRKRRGPGLRFRRPSTLKRFSKNASRPRQTAGQRSSPGVDPGTPAGDVGCSHAPGRPRSRLDPRCRRLRRRPGGRGAGAADPPASRGPGLIRVPPPSGHLPRLGREPAPRRQAGGPGKLAGLVAGNDGDRAGAGGLRGGLRRGTQVPPAGLGGDRAGGRPGQPHARHSIFVVRAGRRSLLIGTGAQGAPTLLGELTEADQAEPDRPVRVRSPDRGPRRSARGRAGTKGRCRSSISAWRKRNDRFAPAGSDIGWRPRD